MRISARLGAVVSAVALALTLPVAGATAAPAAPLGESGSVVAAGTAGTLFHVTLTNRATGRCLEDRSGAIKTGTGCGNSFQRWDWQPQSDGWVIIKNVGTGRCLDASASGGVYMHSCNGGWNQKWSQAGDATISNATISQVVLDSNSNGDVYMHNWNGNNNQKWNR
ncbi:hypothetical protein HPO96_07170 [Kribbella sandramycini]|uniref:Ricin B lectin domain-containing protein n=1 Tax=Kribbella sandramycini TaxID=60450 RepID=A0A7Y4KWJ6_9ACTN|nr:ricin-type beta-trefoil lectin domain protein [Kribbella sandramycini]MBB6567367.1 hypothetical protein [Kribbella sandramycini]NOL40020.1 hypothetical protein [Kribbella sandramycini]